MKIRKLLLMIGIFLVFDGIWSLYFGNSCLSSCANNNSLGNIIRIIRTLLGGELIYVYFKK